MDSVELDVSKLNWPTLSGTVLPGGYEVGELAEAAADKARFRVRVLGDWSRNAFMDAFCAKDPGAEEQLALWLAASDLDHPSVSTPLAAGRIEQDGVSIVYAIAPTPDETLDGLLNERAVTVEEAREILLNVRQGLDFLHAHGWVHGYLSPAQVLAFGDSIRISSEYAGRINAARPMELVPAKYVAPEAPVGNLTPAADVWCLGATLFEALTQKAFSPERASEVSRLPQPFNTVVERCLDANPQTRWSLAQIGQFAASGLIPTAEKRAAVAEPVTSRVETDQKANAPVFGRLAPRYTREEPARSSKLWIYAVIAGLIVLVLVWALWPRRKNVPAQASAAPAPSQQAAPVSAAAPAPAPVASAPASNPVSTPAARSTKEPATINGPVWRVIVFTYARKADAENKAQSLNERHSNLDAKVFTPSDEGSAYLVTVGGTMTRDQATRMRQRAIGMGLPRDTYIQNYKQ